MSTPEPRVEVWFGDTSLPVPGADKTPFTLPYSRALRVVQHGLNPDYGRFAGTTAELRIPGTGEVIETITLDRMEEPPTAEYVADTVLSVYGASLNKGVSIRDLLITAVESDRKMHGRG